MPFINELVTDADIDDYGLPFEKGLLHYWTHDRANRRYLWGGMAGNPAYDDFQEGRFWLYTNNRLHYIVIEPGEFSKSYKESPYRVEWKRIIDIVTYPGNIEVSKGVLDELKEALTVYGVDGRTNKFTPVRNIIFNF
ncbi:MAG: hypothetical protein VKK97_11270 [Synechococcaceae cyanobacterium]|nr:hypothetical protein [Synechococcaceae cyanobacterium]